MNAMDFMKVTIVTTIVASCSAHKINPDAAKAGSKLTLKMVEKIKPGKSTKTQIEKLFGNPSRVSPSKDIAGEYWYYKQGAHDRASFFFPRGSSVVDTVDWEVFEGDPEQRLRTALGKYPTAKWKVKTVEWVNPHAIPNVCYFQDARLGVSVAFRRGRGEVRSIWWWDPTRSLATTGKKGKPPKVCLGDDCQDAIPGDEWLRKTNWKLCEVPR